MRWLLDVLVRHSDVWEETNVNREQEDQKCYGGRLLIKKWALDIEEDAVRDRAELGQIIDIGI